MSGPYTEGQRLKGSDGNIYVVQNGVPVREQTPLSNPKLPGELATQTLQNQRTQQEIRQAEATATATTTKTKAEADKAVADAVIAQQKADQAKAEAALQTMGPTSQVHGEEYLRRFVPPQEWETVRAYARGDLGARSGGMSTSMLPIIQHALNYDPSASGTNFAARVKMQSDLAGSQPNTAGGALRAMERMLLHGQEVLHGGAALDNFGPGILGSVGNAVRTAYERHADDPALHHYEELVRNYGPEAQKAIAQVSGGQAEREDRSAAYAANMSQQSRAAALQADAKQAFDAMGAVNDQYRRLMGHDIVNALNPAAKRAYDEIMAGGYDKQGQPLHPAEGWTPNGGGGGTAAGGAAGPNPTGGPSPVTPWDKNSPTAFTGATGDTQIVDDPKIRALVASMVNAHVPLDQINSALASHGWSSLKLDEYRGVQKWMANPKNRGKEYPASSVQATHPKHLTLMQQAVDSPWAAGLVQGVNAFDAGIPGALTGERGKGTLAAMSAVHPVASGIGEIGGTVAGSLAAGAGAARLAAKVAEPTVAAILANPRAVNTAYGAVSGATHADNPLEGALTGAIMGFGGDYLGSKVAKAAPSLFGLRPPPDALNAGERAVYDAADQTGIPVVQDSLAQADRLGVPAALADVSPPVNALTGSALRNSPDAMGRARAALTDRSRGQYDRFTSAVERDLGPVTNVPQRSEDLIAQAKANAAPLYDKAYAAPGAENVNLADLQDRPTFGAALKDAYNQVLDENLDPSALGLQTVNDQIKVASPSWQTLDYVKRGLDNIIERGTSKIDGVGPEARRAIEMKNLLLSRMDTANSDYAAARAAYSGPAAERDAMRAGQDAVSMNPDQLGVNVANATPQQADQMRLGFQSGIANRAANIRDTANPFEAILAAPAMRDRLGALYPEDSVASLLSHRDLEQQIAASHANLTGNSSTMERSAADQTFKQKTLMGDLAQGALETALTGAPTSTVARSLLRAPIRAWREKSSQQAATDLANQIAPIALNMNPALASTALEDMAQRHAQYQAVLDALMGRAAARGGAVGAGALTGVADTGLSLN